MEDLRAMKGLVLWPNGHIKHNPAPVEAAPSALSSPAALREALEAQSQYYLEDRALNTVWLGLKLRKPMLAEGAPGRGKSELARALHRVLRTELIRVTCGEHTDLGDLFFRTDHARREAYLKTHSDAPLAGERPRRVAREEFIIPGALLRAIRQETPCLVLLDELDKGRPALDNALLEWLEEFTISDSLLGTIRPVSTPYVIITSNNTRPIADQLRDRCCFLYLEYYTPEREAEIIRVKSGVPETLARQVAYLCRAFREVGFKAPPSIREALDITRACQTLGIDRLDKDAIGLLLNLAVKRRDDLLRAEKQLPVIHAQLLQMTQAIHNPPRPATGAMARGTERIV